MINRITVTCCVRKGKGRNIHLGGENQSGILGREKWFKMKEKKIHRLTYRGEDWGGRDVILDENKLSPNEDAGESCSLCKNHRSPNWLKHKVNKG